MSNKALTLYVIVDTAEGCAPMRRSRFPGYGAKRQLGNRGRGSIKAYLEPEQAERELNRALNNEYRDRDREDFDIQEFVANGLMSEVLT